MRKALFVFASVGLLVGTALTAGPDYGAIPAKASDLEASLKASETGLGEAIEIARKATGGVAASAAFDLADPGSIEVIVFGDGAKRRLVINAADGSVRSDDTIPRFPGYPVEGDWVETDSGLKYFDIVVGEGAQPAGPASVVTVHYQGWLNDGTKFDSSVDRGEPTQFPLGRVIPGWTEGVGSMRIGGKRKLIVPSHLGYGPRGYPGAIPPDATLIFDVELLGVED